MSARYSDYRGDVIDRHRQRYIRGLRQALQDVYVWAYTDGKLSELDDLMARADVPIPQEIITRSRMAQVWEEGLEKFKGGWAARIDTSTGTCLSQMMYYSSLLITAGQVAAETVREWLWKVAYTASRLLEGPSDAVSPALEEYSRAAQKHPGMTLECDGHTDATRLFALVEEIGEVAACLTYDNDVETGHGSDLESEVIQVIALALAWATRYPEDGEAGNE